MTSVTSNPVTVNKAAVASLFATARIDKNTAGLYYTLGQIEKRLTIFSPLNTSFKPPSKPKRVRCLHCGESYSSDEIKLEYRLKFREFEISLDNADIIEPMWWCKNPDCDGAGYGYDIHPVKKKN